MGIPGIAIQSVDEGNPESAVRFLIEWVSDGEAEARRYLADLQVQSLRGRRVQAPFRAPGEVAAQVGFGAVAGDALEAGQVGSHCQPQPVSLRR